MNPAAVKCAEPESLPVPGVTVAVTAARDRRAVEPKSGPGYISLGLDQGRTQAYDRTGAYTPGNEIALYRSAMDTKGAISRARLVQGSAIGDRRVPLIGPLSPVD